MGCLLWSPYTQYGGPPDRLDGWLPDFIAGPNGEMDWWCSKAGFGVWQAAPWSARVDGEEFFMVSEAISARHFIERDGQCLTCSQSVRSYQGTNGHYLSGWELPRKEIISRGLQASLIPEWLHVQRDRRLPIIPFWFGFVVSTFFYSGLLWMFSILWRRLSESGIYYNAVPQMSAGSGE